MSGGSGRRAGAGGPKGLLGRLWRRTWFKVLVILVIVVALVGQMAFVYRAATSLSVERVRVNSVSSGDHVGDFTVVFDISLQNPTGSGIDVDRLTYDLYLEDEFIGDGSKDSFTVEPGPTVLDFSVTFNIFDLPTPVQETFTSGTATLTIKGEVTVPVKLLGLWTYTHVTVPFSQEEQVNAGGGNGGNGTDDPPAPVLLGPPVFRPPSSAELVWSRNADADFLRYEVHTSTNPDFLPSEETKVASITDQNVTTQTVGGLARLRTHYFVVRVYDAAGQHTDSNKASVFIP